MTKLASLVGAVAIAGVVLTGCGDADSKTETEAKEPVKEETEKRKELSSPEYRKILGRWVLVSGE